MFKKIALVMASVLMVTTFAGQASALDAKAWKQAVVKKLGQSHIYPRAALSREIEGQAKVRLQLAANGSVISHEIVEPTGERLLDEVIPKIVERMNPLPALPNGKESLAMVIPLSWVIN